MLFYKLYLIVCLVVFNTKFGFGDTYSKCQVNTTGFESHPSWQLLNHDQCGIPHTNRIIGGIDAPIGSYPWIARIGYQRKYTKVSLNRSVIGGFLCSGTIISKKHVITAAHCIRTQYKLVVVRLGEQYNNGNPDCDEEIYCNDPFVDYAVSKTYVHKKYRVETLVTNMINDIGLLKTEKEITFTDFIKPICIMSNKLQMKDLENKMAEIAGWGHYRTDIKEEATKLQMLTVQIRNPEECSKSYVDYLRRNQWWLMILYFKLPSTMICAGGVVGEDSCNGDSGGPLMRIDQDMEDPRYYLVGIVSYGTPECAQAVPGFYTNVTCYIPWILETMAR